MTLGWNHRSLNCSVNTMVADQTKLWTQRHVRWCMIISERIPLLCGKDVAHFKATFSSKFFSMWSATFPDLLDSRSLFLPDKHHHSTIEATSTSQKHLIPDSKPLTSNVKYKTQKWEQVQIPSPKFPMINLHTALSFDWKTFGGSF